MRNVIVEVKGSKLTLTADLDAATQPSASGKTQVIASTEGNVKVQTPKGEVHVGFNLYKK